MNRQAEAHEARVAAAQAAGYTVTYHDTGGVTFRRPDSSVRLLFMEMNGTPAEFLELLDDWGYYRYLNVEAVVAAAERACENYYQEDPAYVWAIVLAHARLLYRQRLRPLPWPVNLDFGNVRTRVAVPQEEWPPALRERMDGNFFHVEGLADVYRNPEDAANY